MQKSKSSKRVATTTKKPATKSAARSTSIKRTSYSIGHKGLVAIVSLAIIGTAGVYTLHKDPGVSAATSKSTTPPPPTISNPVVIDGINYPDPLHLKNGSAVNTVATWEGTRRAEILADFRQSVYGVMPAPSQQSFSVVPTDFTAVKRKIVTVSITGPNGTGSFPVKMFIPKSTTGVRPKGTFLMIDHRAAATDDPNQNTGYLPVAQLNAAGYAIAVINANDVAPDNNSTYNTKMLKLFYRTIPSNGSRAVGAWAWSASRVMDYLQTDPDIDAGKVAVIGHSRSGKAALWAGAQDTRFTAVISNESGNSGAKLARRGSAGINAETVAAINNNFPYWFPQTYKAFNGKESTLPVDQHELLALVAPRRVIIASASNDSNSDPKGEFLSYVAAAQVYNLYGIGNTGLPSTNFPQAADTDFRGDAMSYHYRAGDHDMNLVDWNIYMSGDVFNRVAPR